MKGADMQEVFEKIIEKLEGKRLSYFLTIANTGDEKLDCAYEHVGDALDKAIEIVKQEAEEFATDTNVGTNGWVPVSERLPKERDWYLAVFEEVDTGFIGIPYIADYLMGARTMYTTKDGWIIRNCTDIEGGSSEYYKNLRCVAWQPLPQPYQPKGA